MEIGYVSVRHKWRCVVHLGDVYFPIVIYIWHVLNVSEKKKAKKKIKTGNSIPLSISFELVCMCLLMLPLYDYYVRFFFFPYAWFVFRSFVCHAFMSILITLNMLSFIMPQTYAYVFCSAHLRQKLARFFLAIHSELWHKPNWYSALLYSSF